MVKNYLPTNRVNTLRLRVNIPAKRIHIESSIQFVPSSQLVICTGFPLSVKMNLIQTEKYLFSFIINVNTGDTVEVSVPAGDFYLETESSMPVTLISGGVGITPMMSMYETIAKDIPNRPVTFLTFSTHS